jgi:hypothetical protein
MTRRLNIPSAILIEGEAWKVYRECAAPRALRLKRPMLAAGCKGLTKPRERVIVLADGLADDDVEETFVHELLHALLCEDGMLGPDLEEYLVELLDGPLTRLLRHLRYTEEGNHAR